MTVNLLPTMEVSNPLKFCIRFTDSRQGDLESFWIGDNECVRDVKRRIRLLRPDLALRRLRLIYLGRLLSDGVALVPYILELLRRQDNAEATRMSAVGEALGEAVSGAVRGAEGIAKSVRDNYSIFHDSRPHGTERYPESSKSSDRKFGKGKTRTSLAPVRVVWLQCHVGEEIEPGHVAALEDSETSFDNMAGTLRPLRGFDRLIEAGLTEAEVASVRHQFHEERLPSATLDTLVDEDEHARALEEQWLEGLGANDEGYERGSGVYTGLFKMACLGFLFPLMPLFFFRTTVFDRKAQLACCLGLALNLAFGTLRWISSR